MRHALRAYLSIIVLMVPVWTQAAGPGLGNLTYSTSGLWKPIAVLDSPQGHGNVAMVNGYLMVIYASDGGVEANAGGIEFWDVSNPRRPVLVVRYDNNDTHGLREAHGFSLSTDATRTIMVAQAHEGILPAASRPYAIAFSPGGGAAYVTLQGTGRLLKLDLAGRIVGDIDVGPKPRGLALSGGGRRLLVTRFISPGGQGEVREVDTATLRVVRTFALAFDPGPDTEASGRGVPNYLSSIRISPDGLSALVPSKKDNTARGLFRNGQALTFESAVRTSVSQLDLTTHSEDLRGRIDLNDRDMAQWVLFSRCLRHRTRIE